jgi:hypothetical protein
MHRGYDFGDSYFMNPYLNWEKSTEEKKMQKKRRASERTIEEIYASWDGRCDDIRDRTSWRTNSGVHVPSAHELRRRGLSDVSTFIEISKALFQSNPMEYLRDNAREIVAKYHLYKALGNQATG